jgi:hypothetical protein
VTEYVRPHIKAKRYGIEIVGSDRKTTLGEKPLLEGFFVIHWSFQVVCHDCFSSLLGRLAASKIIQGRTIQSEHGDDRTLFLNFDDQSSMKIEITGSGQVTVGAKVKAVRESGDDFQIDLENGAAVKLKLSRPGASVVVRDKNDAIEYIG